MSKKQEEKKDKSTTLLIGMFLSGIILIMATYAWFSATLNVRIRFFDLSVSTEKGLFISLNGIDFSDTIEISAHSLISDLTRTYPNHTNQWALGGLYPVSSNGNKTPNDDKFAVYVGEVSNKLRKLGNRRFLNTIITREQFPSPYNSYISFDIFLKNVSGSPKSDNLFFHENTYIEFEEDVTDDVVDSMQGLMNSMRIGIVKIGSVPSNTDVYTIQNLRCNNDCNRVIYEPNYLNHSEKSIEIIKEEYGITMRDGQYIPTYAIINEGMMLRHDTGHPESGIPLDTTHFQLQENIFNFENPIYQIPNGITKMRVYVWIEGQDMDSLETKSAGASIYVSLSLEKDLAGYE